jgi:hypothetical protein
MATITLTAKTPAGGAISDGTLNISGKVIYGTVPSYRQWNENARRTTDGIKHAEQNGVEICTVILRMKALSKVDGVAFRTWFRTKLKYQLNRFDIGLNGNLVDLGSGEGVDISLAEYPKSILSDRELRLVVPGLYDLNLPFEYNL